MEHIQIVVTCSPKEIKLYTALFKEFHDIFTWYYEEMPSIYPQITVHRIETYLGAHPV